MFAGGVRLGGFGVLFLSCVCVCVGGVALWRCVCVCDLLIFSPQERTGLHTAWWAAGIPLTTRHSVMTAADALAELGGPDVKKEALEVLRTQVSIWYIYVCV